MVLFLQSPSLQVQIKPWSIEEIKCLVQYIALFDVQKKKKELWYWPTHKNWQFWQQCAEFVSKHSGQPVRTGMFFVLIS